MTPSGIRQRGDRVHQRWLPLALVEHRPLRIDDQPAGGADQEEYPHQVQRHVPVAEPLHRDATISGFSGESESLPVEHVRARGAARPVPEMHLTGVYLFGHLREQRHGFGRELRGVALQ